MAKEETAERKDDGKKILVDAELLTGAMKVAAEDVLALEPKLTEWDTVGFFPHLRHSVSVDDDGWEEYKQNRVELMVDCRRWRLRRDMCKRCQSRLGSAQLWPGF